MRLQEMKLGKSLEIFVDREGYHYRVVSKIEDVTSDRVCVSLIAARSKVFRFLDSDTIDFVYRDENRLWKWFSVKGDVTLLDGDQVHCFYTQKKGEIYNRRDAFRVFIGEETKITYFVEVTPGCKEENTTESELDHDYLEKICDGFVKDISENGMGIFTNHKFEMNDLIEVSILTNVGKVICKGEIVRKSDESQGIYKNFYGIYFTESSKNLTKFIFAQQRIQIQNQRNLRS